MFTQHFNSG